MRFVKPLDSAMIESVARDHDLVVTIEENAIQGGAGSGVNEVLAQIGYRGLILNLGVPDAFIHPDKPHDMLSACSLDAEGIIASIQTHRSQFSAN
jgi:1-deoxy-D-xylulose-5-phosphate synthase